MICFLLLILDSSDHHKHEQVRWSSKYRPNEYFEVNEIARYSYDRISFSSLIFGVFVTEDVIQLYVNAFMYHPVMFVQ